MESGENFDLLIIQVFNDWKDNFKFSKTRFQKLNIYLAENNINPIDDVKLAEIRNKIESKIESDELPF